MIKKFKSFITEKDQAWQTIARDVKDIYNYIDTSKFPPYSIFKKFIENTGETDIKFICRNDGGCSYIKIPYIYDEYLTIAAKKSNGVFTKGPYSGSKCNFYYNKKKCIELGNGSVNRVSTKDQESNTIRLYNNYSNLVQESLEDIENIARDLAIDKTWVKSYKMQLISIINYIESFGGAPGDYKMSRVDKSSPIGAAYEGMVNRYRIKIGHKDRNTVDPSDVILYKKQNEGSIINLLKSIEDIKEFREKLFNTKEVIGISLKKLGKNSKGVYEFNNGKIHIKSIKNIYDFTRTSNKQDPSKEGRGIKFKVDYIDGEDQIKTITCVLRTFGRESLDFSIDGTTYQVGKSPRALWMKYLNVTNKDSMTDVFNKMENLVNNKQYDILLKIIKGSFKEGDQCFPFIMLH